MNIIVRSAAETIGMLLGLVSTIWLTRSVGPSYFGYYAVMVTVIGLGGLLINAGLSTAGSQRVANNPNTAGEVLWVVTVTRVVIAAAAIVGGLVLLAVLPMDPILRQYLRVGLVVWAIIPLRSEWALVAQGRLRALSGLRVAGASATLLTVVLLIHDASDAERAAWIPVVGAIVSGAGSALLAHRWSAFRRPAAIPLAASIRAYLQDGLHYLKSDVSVFIFTSSDRLFLYAFATPAVVGLYEAAYRVIQPFYMISVVASDAMYLRLAQAMENGQLAPTVRRYVDLMCFATVPVGFFLFAFSSSVISILYGSSYAAASPYLGILGWVITFGYTSGVAVMPFSAWNRPREYGNATGFGGLLNLGLNIALIPPFKGFGAAWATVAAKVAVTLIALRYFRRATDYPLVRDFAEYLIISAAALAVTVPTSWILSLPAVYGIFVYGAAYVVLVAIVRWRHYGPVFQRARLRR